MLTFNPHGPMYYAAVYKISSQALHSLQNYCKMKKKKKKKKEKKKKKKKKTLSPPWSTPMTSVTSTQNTDFEPQNVLFKATEFYSFTAQSMLKDCLTIGAWIQITPFDKALQMEHCVHVCTPK